MSSPQIHGSAPVSAPEEIPTTTESPNPTPPESSTAESSSPETGWNFAGRLAFSPGAVNGRNGEVLAADWFGRIGDYRHFQVAAAALYDLTNGDVRLRLGPEASFDLLSGDSSAAGSTTYHITAGANFEVDWRRAWPRFPVAGPSRLGVDLGIGYGFGTTQAETISLHQQSGVAYALGASLNLVNVSVGPVEVGLDAYIRWNTVDGPVFNSPTFATGGALTFRGAIEQPPTVEAEPPPPPDCSDDVEQVQALLAEINGDPNGGVEGLRAESTRLEGEVAERRHTIETRTDNPLQPANIRDILREQLVAQLVQGGMAAEAAQAQAATEYPDGYNWWETVAALPGETDVSAEINPENCEAWAQRLAQLQEERDGLNRRIGDLDRLRQTSFLPRIREIITRTIPTVMPELPQLNFVNARPRVREVRALHAAIEAAPRREDGTRDLNRPAIRAALDAIFGARGRDSVLDAARQAAARLNGEGIDDAHVREAMRQIHVAIEGHTSLRGTPEGNQSLSERRAQVVLELLVANGVDPARLNAVGFGETRPIHEDEESLTGPAQAEAEAANRRIVLVPDEASVRAAADAVAESAATESTTETTVATPPPPPTPEGGRHSRRPRHPEGDDSSHTEPTPPPTPTPTGGGGSEDELLRDVERGSGGGE